MKRKVIIMIFITITIVLCGLYLHYENTKLQVSNYKIVNNNIHLLTYFFMCSVKCEVGQRVTT